MERLKKIIKNRVIGLILHGKSLEILEQRIEEFKDKDICWVSLNDFDIVEDYILNKINKNLEIIYRGAHYLPEIEQNIRIPLLVKALARNAFVIAREYLFTELFPQQNTTNLYNKYYNQILLLEKIVNAKGDSLAKLLSTYTVCATSSLGYLICLFSIAKAKKIILFGCDGIDEEEKNCLNTYYKASIHINRRIVPRLKDQIHGLDDGYFAHIKSDTRTFNAQFATTYAYCMKKFNILNYPIILNCSPNSKIKNFKQISYDEAIQKEVYD